MSECMNMCMCLDYAYVAFSGSDCMSEYILYVYMWSESVSLARSKNNCVSMQVCLFVCEGRRAVGEWGEDLPADLVVM